MELSLRSWKLFYVNHEGKCIAKTLHDAQDTKTKMKRGGKGSAQRSARQDGWWKEICSHGLKSHILSQQCATNKREIHTHSVSCSRTCNVNDLPDTPCLVYIPINQATGLYTYQPGAY
jgi:hypothetical protein